MNVMYKQLFTLPIAWRFWDKTNGSSMVTVPLGAIVGIGCNSIVLFNGNTMEIQRFTNWAYEMLEISYHRYYITEREWIDPLQKDFDDMDRAFIMFTLRKRLNDYMELVNRKE